MRLRIRKHGDNPNEVVLPLRLPPVAIGIVGAEGIFEVGTDAPARKGVLLDRGTKQIGG
jgi:hypothetical protein